MQKLLESRRFWLVVLAMIQTILFQFVPNFSREVWLSIDAVILVVIIAFTIDDTVQTVTHSLEKRDEIAARMYNQQELPQ